MRLRLSPTHERCCTAKFLKLGSLAAVRRPLAEWRLAAWSKKYAVGLLQSNAEANKARRFTVKTWL